MIAWIKTLFTRNVERDADGCLPGEMPRCLRCGDRHWIPGPGGGASQNLMCGSCLHWINYHQGIIPMDDLHQHGPDRQPCR